MDFKSKIEELNKNLEKVTFDGTKKYFRRLFKRLPDISHLRNIVLFTGVACVAILVMFGQRFNAVEAYLKHYPLYGGTYREGVVGTINQLNPLFAPTNSAEAAADALIFNGLTKHDGTGKIIPDLAGKWEISGDGKTYTFHLKKGIKWQDGSKFTADDVVFTLTTIQNPDVGSPLLDSWKGVTVAKKDDYTVVINLPNAYEPFLSLTDVAVLPAHLLRSIPPRNLKIAEFSGKPVGTGPYSFKALKKIRNSEEVTLVSNPNYFIKKPYIPIFVIKTYPTPGALAEGYAKKEVSGIERVTYDQIGSQKNLPKIHLYQAAIPESDVLFFNVRQGLQKDTAFRQATALAIDRTKIAANAYFGNAVPIYAPILPGTSSAVSKFNQKVDLAAAKKKFADAGYTLGTDGILKKGTVRASLRLLTTNDPQKEAEAALIASQLKEVGIEVKVEKYPLNALVQDHIRPRDFDLLLISENLGSDPDLYPFWDSTQSSDPGLNFSGFSDRKLDKLLEQARGTADSVLRAQKLQTAEQIIWDNSPAIYLVRPEYDYGISDAIYGVDLTRISKPVQRFWNVEQWFVETTTDPAKAGS